MTKQRKVLVSKLFVLVPLLTAGCASKSVRELSPWETALVAEIKSPAEAEAQTKTDVAPTSSTFSKPSAQFKGTPPKGTTEIVYRAFLRSGPYEDDFSSAAYSYASFQWQPGTPLPEAPLRFGPGRYFVAVNFYSAAGEPTSPNMTFEIQNTYQEVAAFTLPSDVVQSDNPEIIKAVAKALQNRTDLSDTQKAEWIGRWITSRYRYEYTSTDEYYRAADILYRDSGNSRDFANLYAAMTRAVGLKTKVLFGTGVRQGGKIREPHVWNETLLEGEWRPVDLSWDYNTHNQAVDDFKFRKQHEKIAILDN